MNHATTYHTGDIASTRQRATTATTPTTRGVCSISTTSERPQRNPKRPKAVRTRTAIANGFLKTMFLPKLKVNKEFSKCPKKQVQRTEKGFYQSLSQLAEHYGISPIQTEHYDYPYNMALAFWDAEQKIKQHLKGKDVDELQLATEENGQTSLSVLEKCDTGQHLHYIPVLPLFELLRDRQKKQAAQLLLSVFCYLYRIAGVAFYREEDAYLFWLYDLIQEWVLYDDVGDMEKLLSELRKAECIGDVILHKIQSKKNLTYWEQHIKTFRPKDNFDRDCLEIATRFFDLYQHYENRHIYLNIHSKDDDYDNECVSIGKYLSFISDTNGLLSDQIYEAVNNDFSEYMAIEEPAIYKHFNGTKITTENLDFEHRFFRLVTQLCRLLN